MDKLSAILKKFLPFWLFLTFFKFGGGLHYTLLAPLGEKVFPLWLVGALIGASAFLQLILDIPAGYLLDRYGYRRLLIWTALIFAFASGVFVIGFSQLAFILSLAISTFSWLFFGPGATAYVTGHASEKAIGRFTSTGHVFTSAGIVLSSALVPFVVALDAKIISIILCAIFSVAFVLILLSPPDAKHDQQATHPHHRKNRTKKNFLREAWRAIVRLRPASILIMTADFPHRRSTPSSGSSCRF